MYLIFNKSNIRSNAPVTEELARNIAPTLLKNDNIPDNIDECLNVVCMSLTQLLLTFEACIICTQI